MKPFRVLLIVVLSSALGFWGCGGSGGEDGGTDSDLDTGTDSDGDTDSDTDSDTGTDSGNDCTGDGVWYDELSGLCWQEPPTSTTHIQGFAISYCDDLDLGGHTDWRLPDIDELISLIRGCVNGTETGDLSLSTCEMTPDGCVETDSCTGTIQCDGCSSGSGPASGCYWDPALSGPCTLYWSSSVDSYLAEQWWVEFSYGFADNTVNIMDYTGDVRCVRSGP